MGVLLHTQSCVVPAGVQSWSAFCHVAAGFVLSQSTLKLRQGFAQAKQ